MNEILLLNTFFLYIVECADNKITQKWSMEIKCINPWRSGFGVTLKIKVENHTTGWSNFDVMSLKQVKMRLSSVCGLHVPVWPHYNAWACSWWGGGWSPEGSPPRPGLKHPPTPGQSVVQRGVGGWSETWCPRCAQLDSIGFRSGERAGQSIASMPSSCRNCWHTPATWGLALSCIRRNPGPTAPAYGLTRGLRISSRYLMSVRLPLASTWRAVRPPKEMPPHTMNDPPPNRSCWRMLQAAERSPRSLQTVTSVTCAQCEPAFICEEHRKPVANLPILVFSGKCQTSCTVLGCKHNPHLWTSGPHTTLMESVSDRSSRHMHICGLLEVILQGSGSAPPAPPYTKAEVAVLLLGCCPPTASSTSPDVLACLLVAPPCSGHYPDRHSKPSCHISHWCAILDELHYLSHLCGL